MNTPIPAESNTVSISFSEVPTATEAYAESQAGVRVAGGVKKPCLIPTTGDISVRDALLQAGGLSGMALRTSLDILTGGDPRMSVGFKLPRDLSDERRDFLFSYISAKPGDMIWVPAWGVLKPSSSD